MPFFHLRVDPRSEADRDKNTDFIRRLAGQHKLHVREISAEVGKEHYHTIFYDDRSESRVRSQWREKFPDYDGKNKKEYQIKEIRSDDELFKAEKYLCKGAGQYPSPSVPPDVVLQTGKYTLDRVVELQALYWEYGGPGAKLVPSQLVRLSENQSQASMTNYVITLPPTSVAPKVKAKKPNFYEQFIQSINLKYREESGGHYVDRDWKLTDTPLVLKELLRHHGKNFRPYDVSLFEKEMNLIMGILTFDSHWSDFYEQLKNRRNIPHL